jgi:hypothetical protein
VLANPVGFTDHRFRPLDMNNPAQARPQGQSRTGLSIDRRALEKSIGRLGNAGETLD